MKKRDHKDISVALSPDILTKLEDGRQHYAPVEAFGGEKSLNERQRLDGIKTKYCLDNGIRLIRIRFDESVDDVLTKILVFK